MSNSSSPLFKGVMVCGEDLSISFLKKKIAVMQQSWAIGFSILEISKYVMQSLYYDEVQKVFGVGNTAILMSDTDSFLLKLRVNNELVAMEKLKKIMDFSNLRPQHPLFSNERKKTPGFLKNEVPNDVITEVVALKSKTYAYTTGKKETHARAKGVASAVKRKISMQAYKNCLEEMKDFSVVQFTINSKNHQNRLLKSVKVAFSSFDDKRFLLCPIHSVPYGSIYSLSGGGGGGGGEERCYFCKNDRLIA